MKVMLAYETFDFDSIEYPVLASPKIDGVRAYVENGVVYSRSEKPIPNKHIQEKYGHLHGYDGELVYGKSDFRKTSSIVMSHDKPIDGIMYWVFDNWERGDTPYYKSLGKSLDGETYYVELKFIANPEELQKYEEKVLSAGYEGVIVRNPDGPYTHGRTYDLLKIKRFSDSEAVVIDMGAGTGRNKQTMGFLVVRDIKSGVIFNLGTGFTNEERDYFWKSKAFGVYVKYKYLSYGVKDKPRHPVYLGMRSEFDMEGR